MPPRRASALDAVMSENREIAPPGRGDQPENENALPYEKEAVYNIPLSHIRVIANVRETFDQDYVNELAKSIEAEGLKHPVSVYRIGPESYGLKIGHLRYLAHKVANLTKIRAIVEEPFKEEYDRVCSQLIENIHRNDMTPLDLEKNVFLLCEERNQGDVAKSLGKSISWVSRNCTAYTMRMKYGDLLHSHNRLDLPTNILCDLAGLPEGKQSAALLETLENGGNRAAARAAASRQKDIPGEGPAGAKEPNAPTQAPSVCTFKVELTPEGFKLSHAVTGSFPVEMFDILKATLTSELYKDN